MTELFSDFPESLSNSLKIAEQCEFNLASDLGYTLPEPAVPSGYTADSYLGASVPRQRNAAMGP